MVKIIAEKGYALKLCLNERKIFLVLVTLALNESFKQHLSGSDSICTNISNDSPKNFIEEITFLTAYIST
jgi:hypothetical protein